MRPCLLTYWSGYRGVDSTQDTDDGASSGGASVHRREDRRLLTGRGQFVDDIRAPGALHGALLRSPHAHARILSIDVRPAMDVEGVLAVFTCDDLGPVDRPLPVLMPWPDQRNPATSRPLARDEVCYVGEPVAFVVARSRYQAEDGLEAIAVTYEALSAAVDLEASAGTSAPVAHLGDSSNVAGEVRVTTGDCDAVFAGAHRVLERELRIHRGCAQSMETRGTLAVPGESDTLTVWTSTQAPHRVRRVLAEMLQRPEENIRVISPDVGGAFGMKGNVYPEEILTAFAALRLGCPVRWCEDRREQFIAATHERDQVHRVSVAVDRDGRVLALRDSFLHDAGAYVPYGMVVAVNTLHHLNGPYRIPNLDLHVRAIYTNKVPTAPYRGAGRPQGTFVLERLMDQIALELGLDPVAVRRCNLIGADEFPYDTGIRLPGRAVIYDSGDYSACLEKALTAIGAASFRAEQERARPEGRLLGLGVSCYCESSGSGPFEGARVLIDREGIVCVHTPTGDSGQGHETVFAQICATALGVRAETVQVVTGDTATVPQGLGTYGSRSTILAGSAVSEAAREVRRQVLSLAARLLQVAEGTLTMTNGEVHAPDGECLSLAELAHRAPLPQGEANPFTALHYFRPVANVWSGGSCAMVVAVDAKTGMVRVERCAFAHDCGVVIHPALVQGQVDGGIAQGIGGALLEELVFDDHGQLLTATLADYLMPTSSDVPSIIHDHVVSPSPLNPLGVKGAGEGGAIPVAAAIARAIEDALGDQVRIDRVPIRPEWVWRALGNQLG